MKGAGWMLHLGNEKFQANPIMAGDDEEFAAIMNNIIILLGLVPEFRQMTAGSLFSSLLFFLIGEDWKENLLKMVLFSLIHVLKKNLNYYFYTFCISIHLAAHIQN